VLLIERRLVANNIDGPQKARRYNATRGALGTEYLVESPIARSKTDHSASVHSTHSHGRPPPLSAHTAAGLKARINRIINRAAIVRVSRVQGSF
jgi:hypothetical protein